MKNIIILMSITIFFLSSCKKDEYTEEVIKSIDILIENDEIKQFYSSQLSAITTLESGQILENNNIIWKSSNPNIARINMEGKLNAFLSGEIIISATYKEVNI